jgi:GWxTD domain-containing protein
MPSQADNLDKAVEQLQYIARGGELKKLKKLEGEEKLEAFKAFWREKDPSPGTDSNELMEEYYRRIEYSDQNFGGFREGWKTDRGMIYTLLGPPSEVERHPFDSDAKPYEIWTYYTINRYFLFVDHTGLGDYRLEGPASFDALNRIR